MANIDWICRWCSHHRWIFIACLLHWLHIKRSKLNTPHILCTAFTSACHPQEDDRYYHTRYYIVGLERGRQQIVAGFNCKGYWKSMPRNLSIARCSHPQGKFNRNDRQFRACNLTHLFIVSIHVGEGVEETTFRYFEIVGIARWRQRRQISRRRYKRWRCCCWAPRRIWTTSSRSCLSTFSTKYP